MDSLKKYAIFAMLFWLIVSLCLIIACHHGFRLMTAIFISLSIIWGSFAVFWGWIFATDGRKAWFGCTTPAKKIVTRAVLVFYAVTAITLLATAMMEMIVFLL